MLLLLFSRSVVSSSLLLHGLQHARLPFPHVILKKKKKKQNWHFRDDSVVKNLPANAEDAGDTGFIPGLEDPLEKEMAPTHSSVLAWRIPMDRRVWWTIVHGGCKVLGMTEQLCTMGQREGLGKESHGCSCCVTLGKACATLGLSCPTGKQQVCLSSPAAPPPL